MNERISEEIEKLKEDVIAAAKDNASKNLGNVYLRAAVDALVAAEAKENSAVVKLVAFCKQLETELRSTNCVRKADELFIYITDAEKELNESKPVVNKTCCKCNGREWIPVSVTGNTSTVTNAASCDCKKKTEPDVNISPFSRTQFEPKDWVIWSKEEHKWLAYFEEEEDKYYFTTELDKAERYTKLYAEVCVRNNQVPMSLDNAKLFIKEQIRKPCRCGKGCEREPKDPEPFV